jgi:heptose-I-phosphate ethanolaminephosphotransferase
LPHRVNSIGKLSGILFDKSNSFEVDVVYRDFDDDSYFEVGHDSNSMSGISLQSLLGSPSDKFNKIWLDVKSFESKHIAGMIDVLNTLDSKYRLKENLIVETRNTDAELSTVSDNGYHLSYYLPTGKVLAVEQKSVEAKTELANILAGIVRAQKANAVSFDLKLYGFVKEYLEPILPPKTVYHTWFPGYNFWDPNLLDNLAPEPYFSDSKVKTILLPYSSPFTL